MPFGLNKNKFNSTAAFSLPNNRQRPTSSAWLCLLSFGTCVQSLCMEKQSKSVPAVQCRPAYSNNAFSYNKVRNISSIKNIPIKGNRAAFGQIRKMPAV